MNITPGGLELLARLVVSCAPLGMKNLPHQEFLVGMAKKGQAVEAELFSEKFPNIEMYQQLVQAATESGKECIGTYVICRFFGGEGHVAKILNDIKNDGQSLSPEAKRRILFLHMLIPVLIVEKQGDLFVGRYADEKRNITVTPLHTFSGNAGNVAVGSTVLSHFSSIIEAEPSETLVKWLLEEQGKSKPFQEAAKSLDGQAIHQDKLCNSVQHTAKGFDW